MATSENVTKHDMVPAQARAARALLGWSRDELAAHSKLPGRTIARFELGEGVSRPGTVAAIRATLEAAGVVFTNGDEPGVKLKKALGA